MDDASQECNERETARCGIERTNKGKRIWRLVESKTRKCNPNKGSLVLLVQFLNQRKQRYNDGHIRGQLYTILFRFEKVDVEIEIKVRLIV